MRHGLSRRRTLLARGAQLLALPAAATLPLWLSGCTRRRESAPAFTYTLLDGRPGSLDALRGKVVLVNFWATTCAVCVQEMPQLVATWRRYESRGFDTLAVAMRHDPPALVARFAQTRALPFGVAIDNTGTIAAAFGDVRVTPSTFVLDKFGRIASQHVGAPDFAALGRHIEALLAESTADSATMRG